MKTLIVLTTALLIATTFYSQQYESCFGDNRTSYSIASSNTDRTLVYTGDIDVNIDDTIRFNDILFFKSRYYIGQSDDHSMMFRLNYSTLGNHTVDTIMNLNLNIGDSIFLKHPWDFTDFHTDFRGFIHVVSKNRINHRLVIEFDANIYLSDSVKVPLRFIEGVGVNYSILFNLRYTAASLLLCQTKNDTLSYIEPSLNTCNYHAEGGWDKINAITNSKNISDFKLANNMLFLNLKNSKNYTIHLTTLEGYVLDRINTEFNNYVDIKIPHDIKVFILSIYDNDNKVVESYKLLNMNK